ncbi:MAG: hypothetical protein AAGF57_04605 [Pseudomonadota bacterium]
MTKEWTFSVEQHVDFMRGYLDAVGRVCTTADLFFGLSAHIAEDFDWSPYQVDRTEPLHRWTAEFTNDLGRVIPGLDLRERLGFYLLEYLCWFEEFSSDAAGQRVYLSGHKFDASVAYEMTVEGYQLQLLFYRETKPRR